MASQDLRRASRGCVETGLLAAASKGERPTPWRRVSWMPGAEGAEEVWSAWEKVEGPLAAGTIRRDCAGERKIVELAGEMEEDAGGGMEGWPYHDGCEDDLRLRGGEVLLPCRMSASVCYMASWKKSRGGYWRS